MIEVPDAITAEYWKHPQYLITFDSQHCTGDTTLLVALMQQEQLGSTYPLAIGYDLFKVGHTQYVRLGLKQIHMKIRHVVSYHPFCIC